ncbi:hypothetical protein Mapa_005307 [Marchantia paleacea]|nr:hypothetical protein Mapa_005307 [Marchantia paleacea]
MQPFERTKSPEERGPYFERMGGAQPLEKLLPVLWQEGKPRWELESGNSIEFQDLSRVLHPCWNNTAKTPPQKRTALPILMSQPAKVE